MLSPPDFEQIAQELIHDAAMVVGALSAGTDCQPARRHIDQLLRQVWNARGAADLEGLERIIGKLGDTMDPDNARVFVADAIKALDR